MFLSVRKSIFGIVAMICILLPFAGAQTITGSVSGTVTDVSGAVVPGAKVVAKNTATNVETTEVTNGNGQYTIRFLQIGPYTVSISHDGFKTYNNGPFTLEVNQTAKIEARLENGSADQSVTVQNQLEPILDTENPTLGTTFTANTISDSVSSSSARISPDGGRDSRARAGVSSATRRSPGNRREIPG